jgi:F0F1-type ATP synthase assembly protein I
MANDDDGGKRWRELARANEQFGRRMSRIAADPAYSSGYVLIGAIMIFGGAGYALDRWLATWPWFLVGGLLLGVGVGMWELARTVFRRGGK